MHFLQFPSKRVYGHKKEKEKAVTSVETNSSRNEVFGVLPRVSCCGGQWTVWVQFLLRYYVSQQIIIILHNYYYSEMEKRWKMKQCNPKFSGSFFQDCLGNLKVFSISKLKYILRWEYRLPLGRMERVTVNNSFFKGSSTGYID